MPTRERTQPRAPARSAVPSEPGMRVTMTVNFSPEVGSLIAKAAKIRHQRPSVFVKDAAVQEANRVLGIEPPRDAADHGGEEHADGDERGDEHVDEDAP